MLGRVLRKSQTMLSTLYCSATEPYLNTKNFTPAALLPSMMFVPCTTSVVEVNGAVTYVPGFFQLLSV